MQGSIFRVDPDADNQSTDPPVVRGLNQPSCLRFGPDNEMYVCGRGDGVVLKVTDYS